jgi:hypothetical protein
MAKVQAAKEEAAAGEWDSSVVHRHNVCWVVRDTHWLHLV